VEYNKLISTLLEKFPNLKEEYEENDHLWNLPHCVFEIIVLPYIMLLYQKNDNKHLDEMGQYLEQMCLSKDVKVVEVLNVSLLEPIALKGKEIMQEIKPFLGNETLENLEFWERKYRF